MKAIKQVKIKQLPHIP